MTSKTINMPLDHHFQNARSLAGRTGRRVQRLGWKVEDNPRTGAGLAVGALVLGGLVLFALCRRPKNAAARED